MRVSPRKILLMRSGEQKEDTASIPSDSSQRYVVKHNYHDHANDLPPRCNSVDEYGESSFTDFHPEGRKFTFQTRLYQMLQDTENSGMDHVIGWQPHGRCFVIRDAKVLQDILPQYFNVSKISSFQRQLNLYGFLRLSKGPDRGGYYHELFLRGKAFLARQIARVKVKGTGVRPKSNPKEEPDFWNMTWVGYASSWSSEGAESSSASEMTAAETDRPTPVQHTAWQKQQEEIKFDHNTAFDAKPPIRSFEVDPESSKLPVPPIPFDHQENNSASLLGSARASEIICRDLENIKSMTKPYDRHNSQQDDAIREFFGLMLFNDTCSSHPPAPPHDPHSMGLRPVPPLTQPRTAAFPGAYDVVLGPQQHLDPLALPTNLSEIFDDFPPPAYEDNLRAHPASLNSILGNSKNSSEENKTSIHIPC